MTDTCGVHAVQADLRSTTSKIVAHALTGLLIADISGAAARLAMPPLLSTRDNAFQIATDVKPIVVLSRIAFASTVVVFLLWFFDARVNAELSDWKQRRARSWAFWAWIIPVANLWIPFEMMGDIWRAHLSAQRRDKIAWLPVVWWTRPAGCSPAYCHRTMPPQAPVERATRCSSHIIGVPSPSLLSRA
jgi:hypothetical protein